MTATQKSATQPALLHTPDTANKLDSRIAKQTLYKLKHDYDTVSDALALETRSAKLTNNLYTNKQINHLHDIGEYYNKKIQAERKKLEYLDSTLVQLNTQLLVQKREFCSLQQNYSSSLYVQKQIRVLENRLDKALIKFNEALAYNKNLRENIENLRRERLVFDQIYRKLERELYDKKLVLNEIIEISNNSYEIRNIYQAEMLELKNSLEQQMIQFGAKWQELAQQIENDRNLKNFNSTNENTNTNFTQSTGKNLLLTHNEIETQLKNKITKNAWQIAKDKANIYLSMEKVQSYEEAFACIQKSTGLTDIDELVATFIQCENSNFQLFNYVNELSKQVEKLNAQIVNLENEKTQYIESSNKVNLVSDKTVQMQQLESKHIQTQEKLQSVNNNIQSSESVLQQLQHQIQSIYSELCSNQENMEPVTESNIMSYLGMIENKTNELLHFYTLQRDIQDTVSYSNNDNRSSIYDVKIHAPSTLSGASHNNKHSVSNDSDEDTSIHQEQSTDNMTEEPSDDDEEDNIDVVPLSHEQLQQQIQQQHA